MAVCRRMRKVGNATSTGMPMCTDSGSTSRNCRASAPFVEFDEGDHERQRPAGEPWGVVYDEAVDGSGASGDDIVGVRDSAVVGAFQRAGTGGCRSMPSRSAGCATRGGHPFPEEPGVAG